MSSITGLRRGTFTSVDNQGEFRLGDTLDSGNVGETILSGGADQPTSWGTPSATTANALTAGANVTYTSGNPTWDGSIADTINSTSITYSAGNGMDLTGTTFSTDNDGTTINNSGGTGAQNQVLKVPNDLVAGTNIQFVGTSGPTPTYNGNDSTSINCTLSYQGGDNITIDTTTNPDTIDLDKTLTDMTSIQFNNAGVSTSIIGSNYYMQPRTFCSYLDLSSTTNKILPANVFDVAGDLRMSIELGNFLPNDDSSYFNLGVEDDYTSAIHGTIRPLTSSLEACGYFIIPNGYTATACRIDLNNSAGTPISRTIVIESVVTYGSTGYTSLGSGYTGAEFSFTSNMNGVSNQIMLIKVYTAATTDHIRGGYIKLIKN
tara:strand:+ start:779 stop:1903 length:1125 start_codon:yes stop_codon:yes gene_type:complete